MLHMRRKAHLESLLDDRCGTPVGQITIFGKDPLRGKSVVQLGKAIKT